MLYPFLIFIIIFSITLKAETLTLEEIIQLGLKSHSSLLLGDQDLLIAKKNIENEENQFAWHTAIYGHSRHGYYQQYSSLRESAYIETIYGTQIALNSEQIFGFQSNNHYPFRKNSNTYLTLKQPLLKGRTKHYNLSGLRTAQIAELTTLHQYDLNKQQVIQSIIFAYRNLQLKLLNKSLQEKVLKRLHDTKSIIEKKINLGKLPAIEIKHICLELQKELYAYQLIDDELKLAWINLWDAVGTSPQGTMTDIRHPKAIATQIYTKDNALQIALDNDISLKILYLRKYEASNLYWKAKENLLWDLSVQLSTQWGSSLKTNVPSYHLKKYQHEEIAEINLKIPLNNKSAVLQKEYSKIAIKKIDLLINDQKRKIEIQVERALQNVKNLRNQLLQAEAWCNMAKESLNITQKKIELGYSSMVELAHYTDQMRIAEMQYLKTQIAVLNSEVELDTILGLLIKKWEKER